MASQLVVSMGVFSYFAKRTYRSTARTLVRSYQKMKEVHPGADKKELYALTLSFRPTYHREPEEPYIVKHKHHVFDVREYESLKQMIMDVIVTEQFLVRMPEETRVEMFMEVAEVISEELEGLKE